MDQKVSFSFLKLFNTLKGIHKPVKEFEEDYLEKKADKVTKSNFTLFLKWCEENGITHPKVKYPVLFGSGKNKYPGMLVTENIGPNETIVRVPAQMLLTTKRALESEIKEIFFNHPELFGKHATEGEDNVFNTFILYELGKKEKSFWYPMFQVWPRDTDILFNWEEEDLEWLQDQTLVKDAEKQMDDVMESWNKLYLCLSQYPKFFSEESISFYRYKWVYILTTNRCFSTNWPSISAMIPYAELINHENVDVQFDYLNLEGKSITCKKEQLLQYERQQRALQYVRKQKYMDELKQDLKKMQEELRDKLIKEGKELPEFLKLKPFTKFQNQVQEGTDTKVEASMVGGDQKDKRHIDDINTKQQDNSSDEEGLNDFDYSSGIESGQDEDIMLEQEMIEEIRKKKEQFKKEKEERKQRGEIVDEEQELSKEDAFKLWQLTLDNVKEDDFNFVIKTYSDGFPKGSQVYLCYGRMSNREMLRRYGFCLQYNKYNFIYIKLKLEHNDPDFEQRMYLLKKFFSIENEKDVLEVSKIFKFVKILNFNVKEDDLNCIMGSRSLSLEYLSFQKLSQVYEEFLANFPTSIQEDEKIMKEKRSELNGRQYFALLYRTEYKKIIRQQLTLVKIILHILERLIKGMSIDFAVTRVFELETKKEFVLNRMMIDNYLTQLKMGLQKNQEEYLQNQNLSQEQLIDKSRQLRMELPKVAHRQFEIKGYDKMIERILDEPLKSLRRTKVRI